MKNVFQTIIVVLVVLLILPLVNKHLSSGYESIEKEEKWWEIQSIDTVKYSRDLAKEKSKDTSFDQTIDLQVRLIAETGATHIAIGTPYDTEFIPFLNRWVAAARQYNLKVWFRGNFSGWEGWFGYGKISRNDHLKLTREFITSNGSIFEYGDIYSPCTECENGGPGDPRKTGDVEGFREFIIEEYKIINDSFRKVGKNVRAVNPMNGDVARLIMDKDTTRAIGGVVAIDHYIEDPEQVSKDVKEIATRSGGKVILGEFGAPIPDIHGNLNESQQSEWIKKALINLLDVSELVGVNYWVNFGGSTSLWTDKGNPKEAVNVLTSFYKPGNITLNLRNEIGRPISEVKVRVRIREYHSDGLGMVSIPYITEDDEVIITHIGYEQVSERVKDLKDKEVILKKRNENLLFKILKIIYRFTKN